MHHHATLLQGDIRIGCESAGRATQPMSLMMMMRGIG
jgi:hypothetical protein